MGLAQAARASQEQHAVWRSVKIACDKCGEAGEVSVEASVQEGTYKVLKIVAFGREHVLSGNELSKLRGFPLSDVLVTHEPGYRELGGYTVSLRLTRMFHDKSKALLQETAVISICKGKPGQTTIFKSQAKVE